MAAKHEFVKFYNILLESKNATAREEFNNVREIIRNKLKSPEETISSNFIKMKNDVIDEDIKKTILELEELHTNWVGLISDVDKKLVNKDQEGSIADINSIVTLMNEYIQSLSRLENYTEKMSGENHSKSNRQIKSVRTVSTIIVIFTFVLSILIAFVISRNILKSLSMFNHVFVKGSSGDLNAKYPVQDEAKDEINGLGVIFNNFINNLHEVIKEVSEVADDLNIASENLFETTSSFSKNTQNQAASSEQITVTMEEVTAGVNNISNNSQIQQNKLNEVISLIKELSDKIDTMAERITTTRKQSTQITEQAKTGRKALNLMNSSMDEISQSSKEVTDIIQIIGDISGEINLLSLNAAIEAARAGESGKGFAVVADEISKLADQTASSISQIASLIEKNNNEITDGMRNVDDTIAGISKIIKGVESIDKMMTEIILDVNEQQDANKSVNLSIMELKNLSDEVKFAADEQRTAAEEIMKSMTNINQMVQSSAGGSEEIAGNVEKLSSMADHLKGKIAFFKIH
ncbi:MAG: methyl-accepting chemotaxis protein [Spirochaetes bacterium]|nr:methyl-accepting chemotaxis protein [Spirochaetota bacterium]